MPLIHDREDLPVASKRNVLKGENYFAEGELPLAVIIMRHDQTIRPHAHDFIEVVFFASGTASHHRRRVSTGEDSTEAVQAGDLLIIPPGEEHAYIEPNEAVINNCLFNAEVLEADLPAVRDPTGNGNAPARP